MEKMRRVPRQHGIEREPLLRTKGLFLCHFLYLAGFLLHGSEGLLSHSRPPRKSPGESIRRKDIKTKTKDAPKLTPKRWEMI
jgi:hypothetical protein